MTLSWLSVDARTGIVFPDLPDLDVPKVSRSICRYDAVTATLPVPTAPEGWELATRPGGAVMLLFDSDVANPLWGGLVTQRTRGSGDTTNLALATIEAYFDRRFVGNETYLATGQNAIVADLVANYVAAGPLGGIPIRVVQVGGAGALRDRTYLDVDDKSVYSILTELSGIQGGPEWTVEWEHQSNPERYTPVLYVGTRIGASVMAGMAPTATFDLPGCVTEATYVEDYSSGNGANLVIASSSGVGGARPQSPLQLGEDDGRPTYEYRFTPSTSITVVDTLTDHALRTLSILAPGSTSLVLSAAVAAAPKLGTDWGLGDDVGYSLTAPAFPDGLSGVARCFGWEMTLGVTPIVTPILSNINAPLTRLSIVFDGDSITAGAGSTGSGRYTLVTTAALHGNPTTVNLGIYGQDVSAMLAKATTAVDPLFDPNKANVCSVFGGTNDIYHSTANTAAVIYANLVAYGQGRRAAGFKVIAYTVTPRSNAGTPVDFETRRQALNALIVAGWSSFADALVDIGNDPIMGPAGAETNTTYYADLLHPTNAGHARIAGLLLPALARLGFS